MRRAISLALAFGFASLSVEVDARRIAESDIREHIAILASDDFEGREPGTSGEEKTIKYISEQWANAGLVPGAKAGGWFDPVPLVSYRPLQSDARFEKSGRELRFDREDMILVGREAEYSKNAVPIVFGGTGLTASGQIITNVGGKAVLVLADGTGDAGVEFLSAHQRASALIDAGAEAVIFVTDIEEWRSTKRRLSEKKLELEGREPRAPIEGAVSTKFAIGLVTAGRLDWDRLIAQSRADDFDGVDLGISADFEVKSEVIRVNSSNVIGKIPGKKSGSGAMLFLGHWDHFGYCGAEGESDRICNGAVDNASGIAVLIEVAKILAKKKHDRDIYFLATTAEETGLLGAHEFSRNPAIPLHEIVLALNIDSIAIAPRGTKVSIVGRGTTPLASLVERVAKKQRRKIEYSNHADAFLKRQDGWVLTQNEVPTLVVGSGFSDEKLIERFFSGPYHGVDDELTDATELGGAVEDANLHVALGRYFASTRKYKRKATGE